MKIENAKEKLISLFLENKEKFLIIGIIILALIIATSIYRNQTKNLNLLNIKKNAEIKKNEVLNEIRQLEKRLKFYGGLSTEKDVPSITDTISNIARESNVKIISIKPDREEKQPVYIKYPFILTVSADSYHTIGKFISKIENYSAAYFIDAITMGPLEENQLNKELSGMPQSKDKLIVKLRISIIAFTS